MKTIARATAILLLALVGTASVALAQGVADLLTMSPTWETLYNDADLDALVGLYTEDAVLMPPDMPAVAGVDMLRAINRAYMDLGLVRSEVPVVEAHGVFGDQAWGAGPYRFFDADGNLVAEGKYLVVYRFVDGTWRIARHMWSNDAPLPAPEG